MQFLPSHTLKKVYKLQIAAIASISMLLLLKTISAEGQPQTIARRGCIESNGRVIGAGDRYLRPGSRLCPGDRINPTNGSTVKILCYLNRNFLYIKQTTIFDAQICATSSNEVKRCSVENIDKCRRKLKGPSDNNNEPEVISPYGSSVLNPRPEISWYAVAGADSYTVQVEGNGVKWEKEVKNTTLTYPKSREQLLYGNAYKITVIANIGISPISADTSVINLLSETDVNQILEKVEQVNSLNLPPDEAAFLDLDAVYMGRRLLNETINTLKKRVAAGSSNPTLYRTLGDRYLEARLPEEARRKYTIAAQLAQNSGNSNELEKAQQRLKLVKIITSPQ